MDAEEKAAPHAASDDPTQGLLTRDGLLSKAGDLNEEILELPRLGKLLVLELTGADRALILQAQAEAYQDKKVDVIGYQRRILLAGIVDPLSPKGNRQPLLRPDDADRVMQIGGGSIALIVKAVERLSGIGQEAETSAEGNLPATPSSSSTTA